ncbi:helix-turn-helix domain-containing protein [Micromonospora aurantiaca (nom. illeg.)]|uniref:helix-turn-helix domain-containing protein n=1 Tax=Micromonospora aurantiaca (nom. illeg.) TaxID=47850 RepID=UPI0016571D90|nr:helix-turn-helix domain-containing protein [Micromonospora aurantiaca]MBC9001315.1 helix-turn-helix domain-containing protein [Micromonospora aurantiaca]
MRTKREWNREAFFRWLDAARKNAVPPIPHDGALAELAGISHSTLSNWRNGKQRPTTDKLAAIADVLGVPARDLWVLAGLMEPDQVGLAEVPSPAHLPPEDEESIRMIMASDLPEDVKADLVGEIRRLQQQHVDERASFAQRLLAMARRVARPT